MSTSASPPAAFRLLHHHRIRLPLAAAALYWSYPRRRRLTVSSSSSPPSDKIPNLFPGFCPLLRMEIVYYLSSANCEAAEANCKSHATDHSTTHYSTLWASVVIKYNIAFTSNTEDQLNMIIQGLWTRAFINKNKGLVEHLKEYGMIKSKNVAEVVETIDRGLFVPDGSAPYADSPMPIGYNATISAPHMHATCLELLNDHLKPGMSALDVGSGTGYLTACFAMMVGPDGHAVGVEHIPELAVASIENINRSAAAPLMKGGSLSVHVADGRLGWPELAPYDAIHVGAAALEIPKPLLDQLKPGGRMVIPVGNIFQDLKVVDKTPDGSVTTRTDTSVRYVPLTSRSAQLQDS